MTREFLELVRLVTTGDTVEVSRRITGNPALVTAATGVGATRHVSAPFFLRDISHFLYAGDTALHIAAAAFQREIAALLIENGADCRAKNRRGAQPLHYAADANRSNPSAQAETITYLVSVGADPNALDRSGVSPLHRAVRTRSAAAVRALLDGGADARQPNKSGSTPLHLAVQTTGRGGSGSPQAREQQAAIVALLLERGGRVSDRDGRGRDVQQAAKNAWARVGASEPPRPGVPRRGSAAREPGVLPARVGKAAVGFTIKSGWACVVLLVGPAGSPSVVDTRTIELSDPAVPDSRQPYHAGFGTARAPGADLSRLVAGVKRFGFRSAVQVLREYRTAGYKLRRAGLVVGSLIDPAGIANDHIRIHALEGQLFRNIVKEAAEDTGLACSIWRERDLGGAAAQLLDKCEAECGRALEDMGRGTRGPWRSEQKRAALAAWLVLASGRTPSTR